MRRLAAAAVALVAVAGGSMAAAPARQAVVQDWSRTVSATPEGGFRVGNPTAALKLVEYGSLTCPHCAAFSAESKARLPGYVRSGRVSFEFRPLILNAIDVSASLLARCAGPRGFFPFVERVYATQPAWTGKVIEQSASFSALPDAQKFARVAELGGLTGVAARAGLPAARARACLADQAGVDRLVAIYKAAGAIGVERTPTFLINGKVVPAADWASLEPLLKPGG